LAGTTIHELGHCLAGTGTGHGRQWKLACKALGLIWCQAGGQAYSESDFAHEVWARIARLPSPSDGVPLHRARMNGSVRQPCRQGIGTRGGRSRGPGSGRLRLYECECPVKVRVASNNFQARCLVCLSPFKRVDVMVKPSAELIALAS
jgi:hypothetical protein